MISDDALFSHLTYLAFSITLQKRKTQKTAHWCIVRATQSNCCNALNFLSPEPCPKQLSRMRLLQDVRNQET